jgi:TonB family protein
METASVSDISGFLRAEGWVFSGSVGSNTIHFGVPVTYSSAKWVKGNYESETVYFYDSQRKKNFVVLDLNQTCYNELYAEFSGIQEGVAEIRNNTMTTTFSQGNAFVEFVEASITSKRLIKLYNRVDLLSMQAAPASLSKPITSNQTNDSEISDPINEVEKPEEPFTFAQEMPQYPGGELQMQRDIMSNAPYPEMEEANNIQGKVYVQFVVEKDGTVSNVRVQRGVQGGPNLSEVAVNAVQKLKRFAPARSNGRPVRLVMTIPVNFTLK